jgi:hypothetical protein
MINVLASSFLNRRAKRRLSRTIHNPILRIAAVAAAGYAIERLVHGQLARRRATA